MPLRFCSVPAPYNPEDGQKMEARNLMKALKSVVIKGCSFEIRYAAAVAEMVYSSLGKPFILTSARDGQHTTSIHGKGNAFDCRTRHLTKAEGDEIFYQLKVMLEPLAFDVVDERKKKGAPHFHIEFDPKLGEDFLQRVG